MKSDVALILIAAAEPRREALRAAVAGLGAGWDVGSPPALIWLDLGHGDDAGEALAAVPLLRQRHPEVPLLALYPPGAGQDALAERAVAAGACACLPWPGPAASLHAASRQAVELAALRRDRQRAADALRQAELEWQRTFDTLPDAIAVCLGDGRVRRTNRALRDAVGLSPEELRLRPVDEVLAALAPLRLSERIREAVATGGVVSCDETPPGGRTYTATISPTPSEAGAGEEGAGGAVLLLRDVTNERRMQRRLLLGERMAAVGQLAAGLAHEINNPVSFAFSNLQMARELLTQHARLVPPPLSEMGEMLDECLVGLSRVRDIVRDLRTFTSTEVRDSGEVHLDDLADLAVRLTRSEVQRRARLVYERDLLPTPPLRGDASKLGHVLLNLLSHALHNLPEDAPSQASHRITVRTRVDRAHGVVELLVADTGPPLAEEVRAHLFEPFAQRRLRLRPGVSAAIGMGLAVSHEVIRRHGGEILARAGSGGGNELLVRLPLPRPQQADAPPARGKVLFIDDEPLLLRSYRRLIGDLHDVTTVSSAAEALELLGSGEGFDAIFCDLIMPVMDGAALFRAVQGRDAAAAQRFVFLTGGAFSPQIVEFLRQVDNPHVDKPVGREALLRAIAQAQGSQG